MTNHFSHPTCICVGKALTRLSFFSRLLLLLLLFTFILPLTLPQLSLSLCPCCLSISIFFSFSVSNTYIRISIVKLFQPLSFFLSLTWKSLTLHFLILFLRNNLRHVPFHPFSVCLSLYLSNLSFSTIFFRSFIFSFRTMQSVIRKVVWSKLLLLFFRFLP